MERDQARVRREGWIGDEFDLDITCLCPPSASHIDPYPENIDKQLCIWFHDVVVQMLVKSFRNRFGFRAPKADHQNTGCSLP